MSETAAAESMSNSHPVTAILAGGLATRLGAVSATVPKSLLRVGGEPFIAHQLRGLTGQGFTEVVICVGHLGRAIKNFAGDGSAFGCRVRYSFDGERPLGTGGALLRALPLLGKSFLVMYGDSYLLEPLRPVWQRFLRTGRSALMTVFRNEDRWDRSNVEFARRADAGTNGGEILRYEKAASSNSEAAGAMRHIDYGLGCIRSEALSAWATEERFDLASFYRAMLEQGDLAGFEVKERFYEIGSLAGLAETDALLS
jgi:N-acetyl-alpha-D-muramate 1-phosphate uridylyltransferase